MTKTKKIITALVLSLCVVASLFYFVACKTLSNSGYKIEILCTASDSEYINSLTEQITSGLKDEEVSIRVQYSGFDDEKQKQQFEDALSTSPDLLVISLATAGSAANFEEKARAAGIQIIFFTVDVTDDLKDNAVFIGDNDQNAGHLQAITIANMFKDPTSDFYIEGADEWKEGDAELATVNFLLYRATSGDIKGNVRVEAIKTELPELLKQEGIILKGAVDGDFDKSVIPADWMLDKVLQDLNDKVSAGLKLQKPQKGDASGSVNLIIANNDDMARGAINALQQNKFNNGDISSTIPVFGIDGTQKAKDLIDKKQMAGTVELDTELNAKLIINSILDAKDGKTGKDMHSRNREQYPEGNDKGITWVTESKVLMPYQLYTSKK